MNIKDFIIGIIIFLVLLSFSSLFAYFDSPELQCDKFEGKEKDICFLKLAKEKSNQEYCKNIQDFILSHACKGEYWDRNDCKYWELIGEQDTCIMDGLDSYKANICNKLKNNILKAECKSFFREKAISYNNISLCANYGLCIFHYAIETKTPAICETLNQLDSKFTDLCFTYLSVILNNSEICQEKYCFTFDYHESKKYLCNMAVLSPIEGAFCKTIEAINANNPSLCSGLTFTIGEKDGNITIDGGPVCLTSLALKFQDITYCEGIGDHPVINTNICKFYVTKNTSFCLQEIDKKEKCTNFCDQYAEDYPYSICNIIYKSEQFKEKEYSFLLGLFFN